MNNIKALVYKFFFFDTFSIKEKEEWLIHMNQVDELIWEDLNFLEKIKNE